MQPVASSFGNRQMPEMYRVERPSENADSVRFFQQGLPQCKLSSLYRKSIRHDAESQSRNTEVGSGDRRSQS